MNKPKEKTGQTARGSENCEGASFVTRARDTAVISPFSPRWLLPGGNAFVIVKGVVFYDTWK